jgi:6-phosphogluconate dehydrogenase
MAIDRDIPLSSGAIALFNRFNSRGEDDYGAKLLSAIRNEFGGHEIKRERPTKNKQRVR